MKKYYLLFILMIIIILLVKEEKIVSVFYDYNSYDIYYLDFRNTNLTTENFSEYFNDKIDILKITPHINKIYKNKFKFDEYLFDYSSYNNNIKIFKEEFLKELKIINYDDYVKCKINGIKIDMVKVYSNKEDILKIIRKDKNVKYVFNYSDYVKV